MNSLQRTLELVRTDIRELAAYSPRRRAGTWLDNNESPWPPELGSTELAAAGAECALNRYSSRTEALQSLLADYLGVSAGQVLPTRGSDDGIDALIRTFCAAGRDSIIVSPPTFGMYTIMAAVQAAKVINVPLTDDFAYPLEAVIRQWNESVKLIFVCSPNNPTGTLVATATIEALCEAMRGKAVVVVDEAYAEFAQDEDATALLGKFDNLVILRTLSKAFALAGARCGILLGAAEILAMVRKVLPPYLLPQPSVILAEQVLSSGALAEMRQRVRTIQSERQRMHIAIEGMPGVRKVYPSEANFLLIGFSNADDVFNRLEQAGIVVRRFDTPRLKDTLRISIGLPEENLRLLEALAGDTTMGCGVSA